MRRAPFGNGRGRESRKKQQLLEHLQVRESGLSICLDYGVRKGSDQGMSREMNRTKVVERPACHIKKLAPQG